MSQSTRMIDPMAAKTRSRSPTLHSKYDIIILGGGTAGCVLASRLSTNTSLRVLMLEAGANHNDDPRVRIPALFPQSFGDPSIDYGYHTIPQAGLGGRKIYHARGKGLGGSSLINWMALVHPSRSDFDAWRDVGNPGWGWSDMLPYLQKFQTWNEPSAENVTTLHLDEYIDRSAQGDSGPIQASYQNADHVGLRSLDRAWLETFRSLGWAMKGDTLSGMNVGAYHVTSTINERLRERSHAAVAYLDESIAAAKDNLEIVTGCVVDKVLFERKIAGKPLRAKAVQFVHGGQLYVVEASKEIILCAGTFGDVGILERSGIGCRSRLESLGVDVVVENENVGENLQDHIMCGVSFEVQDGVATAERFKDPGFVQAAMIQYQTDRTGPLAATTPNLAYMPLLEEGEDNQGKETRFQQLIDIYEAHKQENSTKTSAQIWSEAITLKNLRDPSEASANFCMVTGQINLQHSALKDALAFSSPGNYTSFFVSLAHPMSRGNVHITSSSSADDLAIDPAYYSHPLDLELMARHVCLYRRLAETEPMKSLLKPGGRRIPIEANLDSVETTRKLVRSSPMSNQHPCGSCSMLPKEKGGVVDSRLKVYGVEALRICDASIMPMIVRGNIMSTVYALAEKGADMIKEDLGISD